MPGVGFETMIPVFERAKTVHALDSAATMIGPSIDGTGKFPNEKFWSITLNRTRLFPSTFFQPSCHTTLYDICCWDSVFKYTRNRCHCSGVLQNAVTSAHFDVYCSTRHSSPECSRGGYWHRRLGVKALLFCRTAIMSLPSAMWLFWIRVMRREGRHFLADVTWRESDWKACLSTSEIINWEL
jgi:hypothetical protein